jgi:hypothetical protein
MARLRESGSTLVGPGERIAGEPPEYFCPVCGIALTQSDYATPEREYYCPFCSTRQTPSVL